jgi:5-methylcytosine-specific restriction endonuclease McrA
VQELALLHALQDGKCAHCGRHMWLWREHRGTVEDEGLYASTDHVVARSVGGSDDIRNKLAMHRRCNSHKRERAPNGCERLWHLVVLEKLGLGPLPAERAGATLADVWPSPHRRG